MFQTAGQKLSERCHSSYFDIPGWKHDERVMGRRIKGKLKDWDAIDELRMMKEDEQKTDRFNCKDHEWFKANEQQRDPKEIMQNNIQKWYPGRS